MMIWNRLRLVWAIFKNKQTPWVVRLILLVGFAYIFMPFDIIPDNLMIVGWIDDVALAIVLVAAALKFTPEELLVNLVTKIKKKDESE